MQLRELDPHKCVSHLWFRPRFYETDLMGIVHHANYLKYFEMGRVEWLRRRGVSYTTWHERGIQLPVVEVNVRYKFPSRFDDELHLMTKLKELRSHSLRFESEIRNGSRLVASGTVRVASINAEHRLMAFAPDVVSVLLSSEIESLSSERDLARGEEC